MSDVGIQPPGSRRRVDAAHRLRPLNSLYLPELVAQDL
jgi:hypothetical protein